MKFSKVLKNINDSITKFFEPHSKLKLKYSFQFCKIKFNAK